MNVLELFAGSRSIGKVAETLGYEVWSSDVKDFGGIHQVQDILKFDASQVPWRPNILWASPPCTGFSVAAIGHHWRREGDAYIPKTETARNGLKFVEKTLEIIDELKPDVWFIENPRGMLRKMPIMQDLKRFTVTYCQYGDIRMKPTDIWTNSEEWNPRPMCKNGATCHVSAPRGSKTGTQGLKGNFERSKLPPELCAEVLNSASYEIRKKYDFNIH